MTIIHSHNPVARKQHVCDYCNGVIEKGEKYECSFNEAFGDVYTWKNHIKCSWIASRLNMFDNCDEGLTEDEFEEYIRDEWMSLNNIYLEDDEFEYPDFQTQLDFVINHYQEKEASK